jgi:hypothetical protein
VVSITPRLRFTPSTHCIEGWVGSRAGLDTEARREILCLCRGSNPGRPVHSQSLYRLSYPSSPKCWYLPTNSHSVTIQKTNNRHLHQNENLKSQITSTAVVQPISLGQSFSLYLPSNSPALQTCHRM